MTQVAVVYHSGYGHTEMQANAVVRGAAKVEGVEVYLLKADEAQQEWELLKCPLILLHFQNGQYDREL